MQNMPNRRDFLAWSASSIALCGLGGTRAARAETASRRPPADARKFTSLSVEAEITRVKAKIADPALAWLFENCYPNTLDTTVESGELEGGPDSFVVTGDIPCMWLRDSSSQVWPYLPLAKKDADLRRLYVGLIRRQARSILIDPYANAFLRDRQASSPLSWAADDLTDMKPGVAERKWEIDSLCHSIRLAYGYWRSTGDATPFDETWREAARLMVRTLRDQQRLEGPGPYHFQRNSESPTDSLPLDGYGVPTRKVGLIHSMFRPSDDACALPFLIPANLFAVVSLRQLGSMASALYRDTDLADTCAALANAVEAASLAHGRMRDEQGQLIWAYEVDGFGNQLFMDDANAPGLLSLPYLGVCSRQDALYQRTRHRALSGRNPYFFSGSFAEGIGGPHVGTDMIWPLSILFRALTSDDAQEILRCLRWLKSSHAGTGFMHEAFDKDDPDHFTRPWFAWSNSLFGELILMLEAKRPHLLGRMV